MGVNGVFQAPTLVQLLEFSERHRVPRAKAIADEVNGAVGSWSEFAAEAGLSRAHAEQIAADHTPIARR